MKDYSWKLLVTVFGLRLIPMRLKPEIYDGKATIRLRFLWMFCFYEFWMILQLVLLIIWIVPLDSLKHLGNRQVWIVGVVSTVLAILAAFLDYGAVVNSEKLLSDSDDAA